MGAEKRAIRAAFSAAATRYDSVAAVQRRIAQTLCATLPALNTSMQVLDAGCGTGFLGGLLASRLPSAHIWRLDAALGMCRHAGPDAICADIEALPLADGCLDGYVSSLAWQWTRPELAAREAHRALRAEGLLRVTSLGPGTLGELRESFRAVDSQSHVRSFDSLDVHRHALLAAGFRELELTRHTETAHLPDLASILRELKTLGASTLDVPRRQGLFGRSALQRLAATYEQFRDADGLPVSYDVILMSARK